MDGIEERSVRRLELLGRVSEYAVDLVRPEEPVRADVPVPVAEVRDALRVRETRSYPLERLLGLLALGDVLGDRHAPDDVPLLVAERREVLGQPYPGPARCGLVHAFAVRVLAQDRLLSRGDEALVFEVSDIEPDDVFI